MAKLATAFPESNGDPIAGLNALCDRLGVERSLKAFGFREKDIEVAADIACKNEYPNPRPIEKAPISELIRRAWAGENARADL
jgi:alcohol dehydrogenase class IV